MTRGNQNRGGGPPVDGGGDSGDEPGENARDDSEPVVRSDCGRPKDGGNAGDGPGDGRSDQNGTEGGGNGGERAENSGNDGTERATDGGTEDAADAERDETTDGGDESTGPEGDEAGEHRIYHRKVTPAAEEANESLLRLIANLERCEVTDLPPLYDQIDHMVEHLFTEPPPTDAQVELEFTYHGYRIELDQSGDVKFMKVPGEAP